MSSFLSDVLTVKDGKEIHFSEKIEIIRKEIMKLKSIISESMKDKYIELEPNVKPDELLISKTEKLIEEMMILQNRIDDQITAKLTSSSKELQNLSSRFREYNYSLQLSNQLLDIHKSFEYIEICNSSKEKQQTIIAATLVKLHRLIIENSSDIKHLEIYPSLKEEYHRIFDNFIQEITTSWQETVSCSAVDKSQNSKLCSLQIQCDYEELTDIIQALHYINRLTKSIESFSTKILQHFIKSIVQYDSVIHSTDRTFSVEVLDKRKSPLYKNVLHNLKLFLEFLYKHFDILIENDENFLDRLSTLLFPEFSSILTSNCISKIIPTSTSELESFKSKVLEIEKFQNYLLKIKFINDDQKFLSIYTSNIDKLYIDKKCEKLLEMARTIMKKDLHDSIRYQTNKIEEFESDKDLDAQNNIEIERKLNKHMFHLPECQISKSAKEILNLVEEVLEDACQYSDNYALRLFYTSRNIFEMYAALVPEIHKTFLETIPQQVALFHNNCIYLAHHLLTLAQKFKRKMPITSQEFSMIYTDQVLLLRHVGSDCFLNHMKYQRDIIFDILRESGLSSIGHGPNLPPTTERSLRQCIRQLELLKTVWIEILPIKVYCRALGCIVNDMVDDICVKVISVEDIPADAASELVTLFSDVVVKRIPQIFPEPVLIEQHVNKWRKLKELIIVLGASLKEIEDRWADGKGPLANEFTALHVKQLVRALFQNTERRSNLLSKIKEK